SGRTVAPAAAAPFPYSPLRKSLFLFSLLLLLSSARSLSHPMGNFSVNRWTRLSPRARDIDVTHVIDLAEIPTQKILSEAGLTSAPRGEALARLRDALAARFLPGLVLTVEGARVALTVVRSALEFAPGVADLPTARLTLNCEADVPKAGEAVVAFSDTNFEGRVGWKEVVATAGPGATLLSSNVPPTDRSRQLTEYPADPAEPPSEVTTAALRVRFGAAPGR
ncbi:MAG: hypothetical protein ACHQM4_05300, partial [Thermoanaerobaculia bacterium]